MPLAKALEPIYVDSVVYLTLPRLEAPAA